MGAEHVDDSDMDSEVWAVEEGGFWSHHSAALVASGDAVALCSQKFGVLLLCPLR